jgi:hypothetical protein
MSREQALAVPERSCTGGSPRQPRTPGRVAMATPVLLATVLLLGTVLVWSRHGSATHQTATGRSATRQFAVNVDLPSGLLTGLAARDAPRQ